MVLSSSWHGEKPMRNAFVHLAMVVAYIYRFCTRISSGGRESAKVSLHPDHPRLKSNRGPHMVLSSLWHGEKSMRNAFVRLAMGVAHVHRLCMRISYRNRETLQASLHSEYPQLKYNRGANCTVIFMPQQETNAQCIRPLGHGGCLRIQVLQ